VEDPQHRLSDLPLLNGPERWQLLGEWNDTVAAPPPERCLHELFEEQVERTPDAMAVVFEGWGLTYRQIDRRANQVAHFLRERGVGPEVPVGVYLERSVEMMVALLGILKSGGFYLSLATNSPRERLVALFEEARVPLVLTRQSLAANIAGMAAGIVCLDQDEVSLESYPGSSLDSGATPENAAYMIHTSGSTGVPKRVVVEHRQLVLHCRTFAEHVGLQPGWSFAAVQSPAVDGSKTTLYVALLTGGCLHMISEDRATDAEALGDYMVEHRIDVLKLAPSYLATLMSAGESERLMPRRLLIYGGEGAPRNWSDRLARMAPGLMIFSNYGPTEATVSNSMYRVRAGQLHDVPLVPLGRPLPHVRYYLLDRDLQPVPVGVAGELVIAGLQVSRGYQRQPHLTAERFLPDPFSGEPGARMYRSGDLVRHLPDGELETLGRTDHQVKIRGFRVELGEIEALLAGHSAITTCSVIAREDKSGEKRLIAFVAARAGEEPAAAELRSFLRDRLPEHMVPAAFVFLDELPRTLQGKVDQRALVVPARMDILGGESYMAPRNAVEQRMAEIWSEVLGRERIGVHDNFFDLGGHSLLAVRLIARIRHEFGRGLPISALFQGATVEHLAALLMEQDAPRRSALVELQAGKGRPPFFCVHPAGGNVFCYVELARRLGEEQPFYGLQRPDLQVELGSIEAMAAHYLEAVRSVQPEGPYRLGGWSLGGVVAFEMARQLQEGGETVDSLVLIDSFAPGSDGRSEAMDETSLLSRFAGDLVRLAGHDPGALSLPDLGAEPTLEGLFEEARKRGLAIPDLDLMDLKTLFEMFRQGSAASRAFEPRPYPGHLTLLRASASRARGNHGWERLAAQVQTEDIPGDHYSILRSPGVETLAERLRRLMA
jgi:amino acid adenylation domain-containing protein